MLIYTTLQLLLAALVLGIVIERAWLLLFHAPLETSRWLTALAAARADGDGQLAAALVQCGRPAWVAEVASRTLEEEIAPFRAPLGDRRAAGGGSGADLPDRPAGSLDELLSDLRYAAFQRLRTLRVLASVATASGFFGAITQIIWLMRGEHGLLGLKAGYAESVALERALLAVALGMAISVFSWAALAHLKRAAKTLWVDVRRVAMELAPPPER